MVGIVVIVLGVAFLGLIPGLQRDVRVRKLPAAGLAGAPVLGAVFAPSWTPCISPTLGAVLGLSAIGGQTGRAVMLGIAYCVGLGLPFLAFGLGFRRLLGVFAVIRRNSQWVTRVGGVLLIVVGVAMVTGGWGDFVGSSDSSSIAMERSAALRLADMPTPELREDEVLVEVHAAGVNLLDTKIRDGEFKLILPYRLPLILGHDVAGVVVKVGSGCGSSNRATRSMRGRTIPHRDVCGIRPDQGGSLAIKPKGLTMEEAASIPLVGLTAWQALVERADLKKGQKVFIQAGSGGVGTFAIQLAKHLGATVATTTSTANVALVKSLGADVVIDYKTQDFERCLAGLRRRAEQPGRQDARKIPCGAQARRQAHLDLRSARSGLRKGDRGPGFVKLVMRLLSSGIRRKAQRQGVGYSFLFMKANGSQLREITRLIEAGAIRPVMDRVFPFESTNEALAYVEAGRAKGKVVVRLK